MVFYSESSSMVKCGHVSWKPFMNLQTFWKVTSGGERFPLEPENLSGVLV